MVIGLTVAYALTAVVALADALRSRPSAAGPTGRAPLRAATAFGLRANAANALQLLNFRIDLFVLSAVASSAELGTYSTAVSVTSVMFLAPQTLAQVVFPRVAALSAGDSDQHAQRAVVEAKSLRHVSLITLVSLPAVAVAMAIAIPLLFGSNFDGAVGLGLILLPGCALYGIASVLAATINGRGFPGYSLRAAALSTPVALALYAALIPLLGDVGAALASTVSYAINFAITAVYYHRATGDRVAPLLVPTREEVADLRALVGR
jgi:O-antigen/teichoic acid export membrane protein